MTRVFGVIGFPVRHSLSPAMHTAAFRALKLNARYETFEVPPTFLRPLVRALMLAGVEGLNVTVPLKEAILPVLDRIDPTARAIGAVNTVVVHDRRTVGYNTDGVGFLRAISELGWRPHPTRAVVLGAGGAARAVAWELARAAGSRILIANRHPKRAERLAAWLRRHYPRTEVRAVSLWQVVLDDVEVLVNATPVGMRATDQPPVDVTGLDSTTLVYDLVYHRPTRLVRVARRRGCVASDGLSMLLYQGAESLQLWLHRPPPLDAMREGLLRAVQRRTSGHDTANGNV